MYRIGFACQYRHPDERLAAKELEGVERAFNCRSTTLHWLNSVAVEQAREKLHAVILHNLEAQGRLLEYVGELPPALRMLRLSSDLLPLYSHPAVAGFYREPAVQASLERGFARLGERARALGVRLSMHPGQYCALGSDRPQVVENSLAEFEYHAT